MTFNVRHFCFITLKARYFEGTDECRKLNTAPRTSLQMDANSEDKIQVEGMQDILFSLDSRSPRDKQFSIGK